MKTYELWKELRNETVIHVSPVLFHELKDLLEGTWICSWLCWKCWENMGFETTCKVTECSLNWNFSQDEFTLKNHASQCTFVWTRTNAHKNVNPQDLHFTPTRWHFPYSTEMRLFWQENGSLRNRVEILSDFVWTTAALLTWKKQTLN